MPDNLRDRQRQIRAIGFGSQMGLQWVASVGVGALIGHYLDKRFHTEPYLLSLGVVLGSIAGFKEMLSLLKRINRDP